MKNIFLLIMVILSSPVLAGFEGKFQGPGKAAFASGRTYECPEVFLHLIQTRDSLRILEGGYNCREFSAYFDPSEFRIDSGILFYQGEKVGKISENKIEIEVFDPADSSTYHLVLIRSEKGITYKEEWLVDGDVALKVTGTLSPLQ